MSSVSITNLSKYVGSSHAQRSGDRLSGYEEKFNRVLETVRIFKFKHLLVALLIKALNVHIRYCIINITK